MIRAALTELDKHDAVQVVRVSGLYRTAPWGYPDQPDFTNAAAELKTSLDPESLLTVLLETEARLGRERNPERWGPRVIDIDLLCCGQHVSHGPGLELPHPRMHLRAFVLVPLLELEPELILPGIGPASQCLDRLETQQVKRVE